MTFYQMASLIAKNNLGEQSALEGYYLLLNEAVRHNLPHEFIMDIREIIADELNHTEVLDGWLVRIGGVKANDT